MPPASERALMAFGLIGVAAILIPLLVVAIHDLCVAWEFLNIFDKRRRK